MMIQRVSPTQDGVIALLQQCGLVVSDLQQHATSEHCTFWGMGADDGTLLGLVGLERYGTFGLVRSLAVSPNHRGKGLGGKLLSAMEQFAVEKNVQQLFLLTTTAPDYFVTKGYKKVERKQAPEMIRATPEFSSLCPCSAICVTKRLP